MGHDTLAARTADPETDYGLTAADYEAFQQADIQLAEFLGDPSFRGGLYRDLIFHATSVSLYQVWMPSSLVREMGAKLEAADASAIAAKLQRPPEDVEREMRELARFFRLCVERDLGLVNSW